MNKINSNLSKLFLELPIGAEFQATVQSNSMLPIFRVGDKVLLKKIPFSKVKPGDIVCFWQDLSKNLIVHRVVKKHYSNNKEVVEFITKGDASIIADFYPLLEENFVGQVIFKEKPGLETSKFKQILFIISQRFFLKHRLIRSFFY